MKRGAQARRTGNQNKARVRRTGLESQRKPQLGGRALVRCMEQVIECKVMLQYTAQVTLTVWVQSRGLVSRATKQRKARARRKDSVQRKDLVSRKVQVRSMEWAKCMESR